MCVLCEQGCICCVSSVFRLQQEDLWALFGADLRFPDVARENNYKIIGLTYFLKGSIKWKIITK